MSIYSNSSQTPADNTGSSPQAQSYNPQVHIVVQPPQRVTVRRMLVPPLVARTDDPVLFGYVQTGANHIFATLALTASNGVDATFDLYGTFSVSGQGVNIIPKTSKKDGGSSSSSSQASQQWVYFIFSGLSIRETGLYTFTVFVNVLDNTTGMTTVCCKASRQVNVVAEAEPPGRPSRAEREILQMLEENRLYTP